MPLFFITEGHFFLLYDQFKKICSTFALPCIQKKKDNMYSITKIAVAVSSAVLFSCGSNVSTREKQIATVRIDTVRVVNADAQLQFPGRVVSSTDANVSFKVAGTIARVYVDEGDHVQAGQLVAELDSRDYSAQLSATEAEYARIKGDAERVMALYKDGAVTASDYDNARFGLQQIEAKLKNHRDVLSYCKIYAPFSGAVQTRFFQAGENVASGMPVLAIISTVSPEIEINLPASSYLRRSSFLSYSAQLDVLPGEVIPLAFVSVMPKANANQLYTMRFKIVGDAKGVAPGMSAWVTIIADESTQDDACVRLPSTAIVEDNGKTFVYVYNASSQVVSPCYVDVVRLHTDGSAVVRAAISPGTLVVGTGANYVKKGERVKPLPPVSETNVGGLL